MTVITDNYERLSFRKVKSINELKVGMMVQILENNQVPLSWKWFELDEKMILLLSKRNALKWVRLPSY